MTLQSVFEKYKEQLYSNEDNKPDNKQLIELVKWCEKLQPQSVDIMRKHGFVFSDLDDPWQKLAFSFYSDLCEINSKVQQLFEEVDSDV